MIACSSELSASEAIYVIYATPIDAMTRLITPPLIFAAFAARLAADSSSRCRFRRFHTRFCLRFTPYNHGFIFRAYAMLICCCHCATQLFRYAISRRHMMP